jgi:hypothetical protein
MFPPGGGLTLALPAAAGGNRNVGGAIGPATGAGGGTTLQILMKWSPPFWQPKTGANTNLGSSFGLACRVAKAALWITQNVGERVCVKAGEQKLDTRGASAMIPSKLTRDMNQTPRVSSAGPPRTNAHPVVQIQEELK